MSNPNSQLDGLGSFNQSSKNAGVIRYGEFYNGAQNLGTVALSAVFNNTSQNRGTIGNLLPIDAATIVQDHSANWDEAYAAMFTNSATFISNLSAVLSGVGGGGTGDATNAPIWDAVANFVEGVSANLVYTNDSRLGQNGQGSIAYSYVNSNSAVLVKTTDSRLTDSRTPLSHTHDASAIVSGTLDPARLPVYPSQEQVVINGVLHTGLNGDNYTGGVDAFTYLLSSINQGTVVTTTDGFRWIYTGSGDKRYESGYVKLADISPDWSVITNKPASFPVDGHTHVISDVTGLQAELDTLQNEIDGKQASGNYVLDSDNRLSVLVSNSAQWGNGTQEGHSAYVYVQANSGSLVSTSDSRLSDSRAPLAHTQPVSTITGIADYVDDRINLIGTGSNDAYTFVNSNSANLVYTSDSRLSDSRTPLAHTHAMSSVNGLSAALALKTDLTDFNALNTFVADNSGSWDGIGPVYNYVKGASAATVLSTDYRLTEAVTAYTYLTGNSASLVVTSDSRLSDTRTPKAHVHDAADITTGTIDIARIPVLPSMVQVVASGDLTSLTTQQLTAIGQGSVVTTTDGARYVYSGTGSKTVSGSYVLLADITPDWTEVANKPATFTPSTHTHVPSEITGLSDITTYIQSNTAAWSGLTTSTISFTIDGGGVAVSTGSKGFVQVPNNFTVQEWYITADTTTTNLTVDVRKATYDNLPTTTSIVAGSTISLTNAQKNRNTSVTGWTAINAGDFLEFYVTDASNASVVVVSLKGVRS